jgi:hypothetical protein
MIVGLLLAPIAIVGVVGRWYANDDGILEWERGREEEGNYFTLNKDIISIMT